MVEKLILMNLKLSAIYEIECLSSVAVNTRLRYRARGRGFNFQRNLTIELLFDLRSTPAFYEDLRIVNFKRIHTCGPGKADHAAFLIREDNGKPPVLVLHA